RSLAPLMTCGCCVNVSVALTMPSTFTMRRTLRRSPISALRLMSRHSPPRRGVRRVDRDPRAPLALELVAALAMAGEEDEVAGAHGAHVVGDGRARGGKLEAELAEPRL